MSNVMKKRFTVSYEWSCEAIEGDLPEEWQKALQESAEIRIHENMGEGYISGELYEYLGDHVECRGWWSVEDQQEPEEPACLTRSMLDTAAQDYLLAPGDQSAWITAGPYSLYIVQNDQKVSVDAYQVGYEMSSELASFCLPIPAPE
jgi:hypothetical protein